MQRLHQLPPMRLAEELLLIDSCALRKIVPEELVDECWIGKRKDELSPNITAMVHQFNSLALLVPTEILAEATPQMRAKVASTFIKVAEACHQLKNYHSLKAVLAGLQCTPVYRLRKTWKKVPAKRMRSFQELSTLMTEEGNCSKYQREIQRHLKNKVPLVPYLGFFLTQIVHLTCRQKLWESSWQALTKKSDLTCPIESDSDLRCPNESHDDVRGCQTGNGNDISILSGFSSLAPSYSINLSCSMQRSPFHSSSPNLALDSAQERPDYTTSLILLGSMSRARFTAPSTLISYEDDECCKLEDAAFYCYLAKKNHIGDWDPISSVSYSGASSQSFESGIHSSTQDSDQDDEQFCKLEDAELYRNMENISSISIGEDGDCVSRMDADGHQADTYMSLPHASSIISADVHNEIDDEYSHSKSLDIGFTDMCSEHPRRRPFPCQTGKFKCSHTTQVDSVNPKYHHSPKALLHRYQTSSLLCVSNIQSREEIRNLIMNYCSNTEMENYMLSYKWEPH